MMVPENEGLALFGVGSKQAKEATKLNVKRRASITQIIDKPLSLFQEELKSL